MRDINSFFSLISINENEKELAREYVELRGLDEHIMMANYLSSYLEEGKPTYSEVATAFRYDKRIRRIVYKYIGLLEEYYRSFLCNNYTSTSELQIKTNKSLYDYCSNSLFSRVVNIVWSLDDTRREELFESKIVLKKNLDALVTLRNAISHNWTLINYRNYDEVTLTNGEIGCSLLANVKNLMFLLPNKIQGSFKEDINNAAHFGFRKLTNQTEWNLPNFLVIKL